MNEGCRIGARISASQKANAPATGCVCFRRGQWLHVMMNDGWVFRCGSERFRLTDENQLSVEVLYRLLETWAELEDHILALSHPQWGGR